MKAFLKAIHFLIIINFLAEIFYVFYIFFFILTPADGHVGPLASRAKEIGFELMVTRRLYAIELWIAVSGLAIYLAITEFYPSLKKKNS